MAKTIAEQLLALLPEAERAAVKAKLDANPKLMEQDKQSAEIYSIYYQGDEPETVDPAAAAAAVTTPPASTPAGDNKPATTATTTTTPSVSTSGGNEAILSKLSELSTSLDKRFDEFKKNYVPVADLPKYRGQMLADAIKASDDYATVREKHREEFGKPLDRAAFEKFVQEQTDAGAKFKDMSAAHDLFVSKDRVANEVTKQVNEQVKQKTSAATVPGQTQSIGMSPAQAVMKKAREAAKTGEGKSRAMEAADRLASIERGRDEAGVGTVQ